MSNLDKYKERIIYSFGLERSTEFELNDAIITELSRKLRAEAPEFFNTKEVGKNKEELKVMRHGFTGIDGEVLMRIAEKEAIVAAGQQISTDEWSRIQETALRALEEVFHVESFADCDSVTFTIRLLYRAKANHYSVLSNSLLAKDVIRYLTPVEFPPIDFRLATNCIAEVAQLVDVSEQVKNSLVRFPINVHFDSNQAAMEIIKKEYSEKADLTIRITTLVLSGDVIGQASPRQILEFLYKYTTKFVEDNILSNVCDRIQKALQAGTGN